MLNRTSRVRPVADMACLRHAQEMADELGEEDLNDLIPGMQAWGDGIKARDWIGYEGRTELAIGYSLLFWPRFTLIDDYVLREGASKANVRQWEQTTQGDRKAVEAVMNHWHIGDLHHDGPSATQAQLRYLGHILRQTHEAKLRQDFPDRTFIVHFNDKPGPEFIDYQLTFWQAPQ